MCCVLCGREYRGYSDHGRKGVRWMKVYTHWVCPACVAPVWLEVKRSYLRSRSWQKWEQEHRSKERETEFHQRLREEVQKALIADGDITDDDDDADVTMEATGEA